MQRSMLQCRWTRALLLLLWRPWSQRSDNFCCTRKGWSGRAFCALRAQRCSALRPWRDSPRTCQRPSRRCCRTRRGALQGSAHAALIDQGSASVARARPSTCALAARAKAEYLARLGAAARFEAGPSQSQLAHCARAADSWRGKRSADAAGVWAVGHVAVATARGGLSAISATKWPQQQSQRRGCASRRQVLRSSRSSRSSGWTAGGEGASPKHGLLTIQGCPGSTTGGAWSSRSCFPRTQTSWRAFTGPCSTTS
mmetsp:Transcript_73574/g.215847  ORF Transcript_73574/g.215847 Transcript_73574/m.215847 type:complete len:255 (+) Transcript_73574:2509-3273(+)